MANARGVKYVSFAEPSGYGVAGKRCLLGLARAGVDLTWTPMMPNSGGPMHYGPFQGSGVGDADVDRYCNRNIDYDVVIVHAVPAYFPYWVEAERPRKVIGHTVWETTAIPAHWRPLLNMVDHLVVPCEWNKTVFQQGGVTVPIGVVPHIADVPKISGGGTRADGDGYVFYTIGTWTHRKALFCTIKAYCEAFTAADPTTLVIKTSARDFTAIGLLNRFRRSTAHALDRLMRHYRSPPRVRLVTDDLTEDDMRQLHIRGDCYVSLCRAEGWGLGAFDAATYGNPAVMTGFGGQLDYLDPDLAYLVDYDLVPVINPPAPRSYSPDQRWAEPDIRQGAARLREIMSRPDEAKARARALQARILDRYGERLVTERLLELVGSVRR